jgi:tellurite methyltransferase
MLQKDGVWARYAEGTAGRDPMEFLGVALKVADGEHGDGRQAVDLGCGAGNEALALLERGWRVHAVDGERRAIEILTRRTSAELADHLTTEVSLFHEAALPEADLVFASLSLPFAADHIRDSVVVAKRAVRPGGWFVGVFLGHGDTWAGEDDVATVNAHDIEDMLSGLEIRHIEEAEFDGPSGAGPKHWHWYVVSAHRRD